MRSLSLSAMSVIATVARWAADRRGREDMVAVMMLLNVVLLRIRGGRAHSNGVSALAGTDWRGKFDDGG